MPSTGIGREPARRRGPFRRTAHIGFRRAAESTPGTAPRDQGRRNEILSSASVILAGVIVVVGFGFVASRVINGEGGNPLPDPPPTAALGGADLPSGSPAPIPIGSPSPSVPPSPSRSVTPPPATSKPTTKPPFPGSIQIDASAVPGSVDLTAEGTSDWVHWGLNGTFSLERRKSGGFKILEGTPTAPRFKHALSPEFFRWTGGDPVDRSDGTTTGIRTCGTGNAFSISAPASTTARTLRLYVGVIDAKGELSASLSAGSAKAARSVQQRDGTFRTLVYTVTYRAPAATRINFKWNTVQALGDGCGGVALQAATLR
ncbi:hypothetical protein GCM10010172_77990 [Paractinoplanes ferrugineus]|uniref:Uncharacterized protein n=1 Tax=Paractinoplanes ferrugineus TaxID=113564 RepID=A0A919MM46_9ACTN|nr:hypothetical protein [Actinoplanes ferrugineus]GIE12872.1 hypothetical protein Afe05nite_47120 [Actinoplanes ferrugineus]